MDCGADREVQSNRGMCADANALSSCGGLIYEDPGWRIVARRLSALRTIYARESPPPLVKPCSMSPPSAVAGSVDSGKSTLVAILTHGAGGAALLDNGRGSARMAVFRHKHEIESGRTSSISQQILGYDAAGTRVALLGRRQQQQQLAVHRLLSAFIRAL